MPVMWAPISKLPNSRKLEPVSWVLEVNLMVLPCLRGVVLPVLEPAEKVIWGPVMVKGDPVVPLTGVSVALMV